MKSRPKSLAFASICRRRLNTKPHFFNLQFFNTNQKEHNFAREEFLNNTFTGPHVHHNYLELETLTKDIKPDILQSERDQTSESIEPRHFKAKLSSFKHLKYGDFVESISRDGKAMYGIVLDDLKDKQLHKIQIILNDGSIAEVSRGSIKFAVTQALPLDNERYLVSKWLRKHLSDSMFLMSHLEPYVRVAYAHLASADESKALHFDKIARIVLQVARVRASPASLFGLYLALNKSAYFGKVKLAFPSDEHIFFAVSEKTADSYGYFTAKLAVPLTDTEPLIDFAFVEHAQRVLQLYLLCQNAKFAPLVSKLVQRIANAPFSSMFSATLPLPKISKSLKIVRTALDDLKSVSPAIGLRPSKSHSVIPSVSINDHFNTWSNPVIVVDNIGLSLTGDNSSRLLTIHIPTPYSTNLSLDGFIGEMTHNEGFKIDPETDVRSVVPCISFSIKLSQSDSASEWHNNTANVKLTKIEDYEFVDKKYVPMIARETTFQSLDSLAENIRYSGLSWNSQRVISEIRNIFVKHRWLRFNAGACLDSVVDRSAESTVASEAAICAGRICALWGTRTKTSLPFDLQVFDIDRDSEDLRNFLLVLQSGMLNGSVARERLSNIMLSLQSERKIVKDGRFSMQHSLGIDGGYVDVGHAFTNKLSRSTHAIIINSLVENKRFMWKEIRDAKETAFFEDKLQSHRKWDADVSERLEWLEKELLRTKGFFLFRCTILEEGGTGDIVPAYCEELKINVEIALLPGSVDKVHFGDTVVSTSILELSPTDRLLVLSL